MKGLNVFSGKIIINAAGIQVYNIRATNYYFITKSIQINL